MSFAAGGNRLSGTAAWDKPGVGGSSGNWLDQSMADRAREVTAALNALAGVGALRDLLPGRQLFIVDTHVNLDPTAEQLAAIALLAADGVRVSASSPKSH